MKIVLAQINTTVGDFEGNRSLIEKAYLQGGADGVELVVAPELAITGYPPRDLLLKSGFIEGNLIALEDLAKAVGEVGLVVGHVGLSESHTGRRATGRRVSRWLWNGAQHRLPRHARRARVDAVPRAVRQVQRVAGPSERLLRRGASRRRPISYTKHNVLESIALRNVIFLGGLGRARRPSRNSPTGEN